MLGNPQLRSGVDITLRPKGKAAIRLLGIHLKSGCFAGSEAKACPILLDQIPALEAWIDAAALGPDRFVVLDRKSTRLNSSTNAHLVCRLLLEKKKQNKTKLPTNHTLQ